MKIEHLQKKDPILANKLFQVFRDRSVLRILNKTRFAILVQALKEQWKQDRIPLAVIEENLSRMYREGITYPYIACLFTRNTEEKQNQ